MADNSTSSDSLIESDENRLKRIIKKLRNAPIKCDMKPLDGRTLTWLLAKAENVFKSQSVLIEMEAPVLICGDIHGQFSDLLRLFDKNGWPPQVRYLFLGDYVDRGPMSLETMCLMFALKIRTPDQFFVVRGIHECRSVNRAYGFYDELKMRYSDDTLYERFNDVFSWMPLAALVADRILCVHGGISPDLASLDSIREIERPLPDVPDQGLAADLLWADPDITILGFAPSTRHSSRFGRDAVLDVCEALGVDMIVRSNQIVKEGYEFFAGERLVTIFTAPDYCNQFTNSGGILCVDENLNCSFTQLQPEILKSRTVRNASRTASRDIDSDDTIMDINSEILDVSHSSVLARPHPPVLLHPYIDSDGTLKWKQQSITVSITDDDEDDDDVFTAGGEVAEHVDD